MAQRKETKKKAKVGDLKPKKDAKGGRVPPGGGHAGDRPGRGDGGQQTRIWGG
jgi:hypothetical protein